MSQWDVNSDLYSNTNGLRREREKGSRGRNGGQYRRRQRGDRRGRREEREEKERDKRGKKKSCVLFADLFNLQILCLPDSNT